MTATGGDDRCDRPRSLRAGGDRATRSYKEIIAEIGEAAEKLRAADRERATALAVELVELEAAMLAVGERVALAHLAVELGWEDALEALWAESWMTLRPRPAPAPGGDPAELDRLTAEVERRRDDLLAAVRRRFILGR